MSMNPFYTSHRIGQLILKRSALGQMPDFLFCRDRQRGQKISLNTPVRVSKPTIKMMAMIHRIIFMFSP